MPPESPSTESRPPGSHPLVPLPAAPANAIAEPATPTALGEAALAAAKAYARASLRRRLAAIGQMQLLHGFEWTASDPAIRAPLRGHAAPARVSGAPRRRN